MGYPDFSELVKGWFSRQMRNPFGAFYLYFRPAEGESAGEIRIEEQAPDGFQIADGRRIAPGWTIERARCYIWDVWRTLPILAEGKSE